MAEQVADHQQTVVGGGGGDDLFGLDFIPGQRFLDQHVHPLLHERNSERGVLRRRSGDGGGIDAEALLEGESVSVPVATELFGHLACARFIHIADDEPVEQPLGLQRGERTQVVPTPVSGADDCNTERHAEAACRLGGIMLPEPIQRAR